MLEFKAHFKSVQPDLGGSLPGRLIFGLPGKDGGYYLVSAEQVDANTVRFTFTPSQKEMPKVDPVDIELPGATDERIEEAIKKYLQNNPAIGKPGEPGFSPIAKVVQTDDGAVITITDKDGTTEVFIANGRNGYTPQKGIDYDDGKSAYEYAKDGGYTGTEADFAAKLAEEYPDVPEWAMADSKPSYSKSEVGLGNVDNVKQYSASNPPPYPVVSVNGQTGKVQLGAGDVGARPSSWLPTAQEVGALPDTYVPPDQTAAQVGADPAGTAAAAVSSHNTSTDSHGDLRLELKAINDRLTAFFDSDNQTLDELSEIVAYITSNKSLIDAITTSKVSVSDIINNLTTNVANKPLSAAQGVVLKGLIDSLSGSLSKYALASAVPTKVSQLENDKGYLTEHQDISGLLPRTELDAAVEDALAKARFVVDINGSGDYTSFAECLMHIRENKIYNANVYVKSGVYDIHQEMIDLYGANYWTDFTATTATRYNLGLPFGFGMKIQGDNGVELKCDCSFEANTAIESQFSILNAMYDTSRPYLGASITGIKFNCKKIRYCIHMEFSTAEAGGEYLVENCSMYLDNSMCTVWKHAACVGMGSGAYTTMSVIGCDCHSSFMANPTKKSAILWHNTGHTAPRNKVVIKDNFCDTDSTISIASKGSATTKTPAIVCNNSVDLALITLDSSQSNPIFNTDNVNLMEWNNIIRNAPIDTTEYAITTTLTNCTGASGNATTITKGTPKTLTFTADSGYVLPDSVVVSGAMHSWNKASGTLVLNNPSSDVQITIIATKFNLAVPNDTNTTDFTIWCNNARLGSTGIAEQKDGYITTNYIPVKAGDTIRVKGIDCYRAAIYYANDNTASPSGGCASVMGNLNNADYIESDFVDTAGDFRITLKAASANTIISKVAYFRISGTLTGSADDVVMTVNQEIS